MALIGAILVEIKIFEILCERSSGEGDRQALRHGTVKRLLGTSRWAVAFPIIAALINRIYYKLISCIPFYCLYRRDPWPFTLVAPGHWATIEPLLEVTNASKAKEEEDLNSNKEVLNSLLDKNSNRQ